MSQENVEVVKRMVKVTNEQSVEKAIEALAEIYHPDAEGHDLQPGPGMPAIVHGRTAIIKLTRQWMDVLDHWKVELHDYVDADPWVICDVQWHAIGKGSDIPVDWRVTEAHEFEDGKVVRSLWGYRDIAAALEAVGLSEQDTHADS